MSDTPARENTAPTFQDKVYRSGGGIVGGVLLLALLLWLCIDAMIHGAGTAPGLIETRWDGVESLTAALSVELRAGGHKFVIWALPVSLRQRKRAGRRAMIDTGDRGTVSNAPRPSLFGAPTAATTGPTAAFADKAVEELNERVSAYREALAADAASPEVNVSWTWWIIAPIAAGALALIILLAVG